MEEKSSASNFFFNDFSLCWQIWIELGDIYMFMRVIIGNNANIWAIKYYENQLTLWHSANIKIIYFMAIDFVTLFGKNIKKTGSCRLITPFFETDQLLMCLKRS